MSFGSSSFALVGITGLEPATSRPPDVNFHWAYPDVSQKLTFPSILSVDFLVDFSPPND